MKAYTIKRTDRNEKVTECIEKYGVYKTKDAAIEKMCELEPSRWDAFYLVDVECERR